MGRKRMDDIVVVVIDTLRAKDIEEKGETVAPFLEDIKDEGIKLSNYYSNAPWTAPAHASMFTEKLPSSHGTTTENPLFDGENRLVREMKQEGFRTAALSENNWFQPFSGFDKGFDEFKQYSSSSRVMEKKGGEVWKYIWENDADFEDSLHKYFYFWKRSIRYKDLKSMKTFFNHLYFKLNHATSEEADFNPQYTDKIIEDALGLLEDNDDIFLFLNVMPVHAPYSFDEEQASKFLGNISDAKIKEIAENYTPEEHLKFEKQEEFYELRESAYHASIEYVDSKLEKIYELAPSGTTFVILGDHGELVGEYCLEESRILGHQLGTFREQIDVPFYLFKKGGALDLDIEEDKLYDHRDLTGLIKTIVGDEDLDVGREYVNSEYFSNKALMNFVGAESIDELDNIMARKSFSIITDEVKLDLTSEGKKVWSLRKSSDVTSLEIEDVPENIATKAEVMYSDYLN